MVSTGKVVDTGKATGLTGGSSSCLFRGKNCRQNAAQTAGKAVCLRIRVRALAWQTNFQRARASEMKLCLSSSAWRF